MIHEVGLGHAEDDTIRCIHEMMVIFHDHSDIKSSAPPLRQCRSFDSSNFLWGGARIGHLQTHMNE
ncbi:hypothetical protein F2P79_020337, partial [Pimephales promelas]